MLGLRIQETNIQLCFKEWAPKFLSVYPAYGPIHLSSFPRFPPQMLPLCSSDLKMTYTHFSHLKSVFYSLVHLVPPFKIIEPVSLSPFVIMCESATIWSTLMLGEFSIHHLSGCLIAPVLAVYCLKRSSLCWWWWWYHVSYSLCTFLGLTHSFLPWWGNHLGKWFELGTGLKYLMQIINP